MRCVEDFPFIDAAELPRPCSGDRIIVGAESEGQTTEQLVNLAVTVPHFGGRRYWFVCPSCRRRVRKLYHYVAFFGERRGFACRLCLGLPYRSQCPRTADDELWDLLNFT